jgi:type II pantothenate kinase
MNKLIGIDAGGTLVKIVFDEEGRFHYRKSGYEDAESVFQWLKLMAPGARIAVTGGRGEWVKKNFFPEAEIIPEFHAVSEGAGHLFSLKNSEALGTFLLVNVGTGTSIFLSGDGNCDRLGGTGLGGGTLVGLGRLLTGSADFSELAELGLAGDRTNADLLVKDIYGDGDEPLLGEMTASNFAKNNSASKEDHVAALFNMVAENIYLLVSQLAAVHKIRTVVFAGGALSANSLLKENLGRYLELAGLQPVFLEKGGYCGAVGAMLLSER